MSIRSAGTAALLWLLTVASAPAQEAVANFGPPDAPRLVLRSTTDIAVFGPVIDAYLAMHAGLGIRYEQWGSNGLYDLTDSDCAAGRAGADLVISSGVHQMVRLVNDACALAHRSDVTAGLSADLRWRDELWGITSEPAVIVYNRLLVPPQEVPDSRFDLLDLLRPDQTRYAGRVATYDIEESGLGYLFAFMDAQEATTFGALMESLGRTGAVATCCSSEIIDGVAEGRFLLAYNILGSYALARSREDNRIGVVAPADYTLLLSRAALIPRHAAGVEGARAFVDFLLSAAGQAALRAALLIVPVNDEGLLGTEEGRPARTTRPISLSPTMLVALDQHKRRSFIARWRERFPRRAAQDGTAPSD